MTSIDPTKMTAEQWNSFNQTVIDDFRDKLGVVESGPFAGAPLVLITVKGARSGTERVIPLVHSRDGDRVVIVASKGGAPKNPAWFHNLVANPEVTVELPGETFRARARVVEAEERDRLFRAHADLMPNFNDYAAATSRVIPVVVLEKAR